MKISTLMEYHNLNNQQILRESCEGLSQDQRFVVEGIYNEFKPLIEASLTAAQVNQLFGQIEKDSTAAGGNRTALGKGVDVAKKANEIVDNIGKWLQNTTPVKGFDQKFDDLKRKINTKFPDSKILDAISNMGIWAQENPGKTAAIVGVLTAIASLAGGPIGGAIAGQVLRGSVELLKGEKLSTAIGKGIKTAAYGFIAGKTFELLGDAIKDGAKVVKDTMFPNALRLNMTQVFDEVGGQLGDRWANFEIKGLVGRPEDINTAKKLFSEAGQYWKAGDYEQSAATWKSLEGLIADTFNDKEYIAQIAADQASRTMISQAAQAAQEATKYLGAAAQGAVAGAGVKGSLNKKESKHYQTRPLSEGQVYLVFNKIERLDEGPMDLLKKGADWAKTKAANVTTKVTADKLSSAWKKAGAPTDSDELADFLAKQGVSTDIVKQTYATMKLPAPGTAKAAGSQKADYDSVVAMVNKLPTDRKARLLKYLTSGKGTQEPAPATQG
jgi:hypothetical protein